MKNEKIKIIEIIPSKDYIAAKEKAKQNTKKDTYITYPTEYNKVVYTHFKRTAGELAQSHRLGTHGLLYQ